MSNNKHTKKFIIIAIISTVVAITALIGGIFIGLGLAANFSSPPKPDKESEPPFNGAPFALIVLEPEKDHPTKEELKTVEAILRTRLNGMGYTEAIVDEKNGKFTVMIPNITSSNDAADVLAATAMLQFMDSQGNIVLTGDNIKDAKAKYDDIDQMGTKAHFVELELTPEGRKKFKEATANNVGQPIYIVMDNNIISAPTVSEAIDSNTCTITGEFTKEEAKLLASQIRSGKLPFNLNIAERSMVSGN